eukprot:12854767-Alexandrium_andersonii.AAC.1
MSARQGSSVTRAGSGRAATAATWCSRNDMAAERAASRGQAPHPRPRAGDWRCPRCKRRNFADGGQCASGYHGADQRESFDLIHRVGSTAVIHQLAEVARRSAAR